jgi:phosphoglycolate phosphatase
MATTVVFDLDGTLVDSAADLIAANNHALGTIGLPPVDPQLLPDLIGNGARAMLIRSLEASRPGVHLGEPEVEALLGRFLAYYSDNIAVHTRPYPDVLVTLERLHASGARLAVCTNKYEGLARRLLTELKMDGLFHAVTGRDTLPVCKPDPGHLIGTVILADGDLSATVMVGDSETDIRTAKAAGIPVIAVTFGYSARPIASFQPDVLIGHYRDLEPAISRVLSETPWPLPA